MCQHQHAPLPLERLKDVPQPVVVLLEKLLEKDAAQRFRSPNELLKALPTITGAIDAWRKITRQSMQKTPSAASRVGTRRPAPRLGPEKIGRLREPSLQALLRELAAFNRGLCGITTRLAIADLTDHEDSSSLRHDLEQLSGDAGACESASDEFSGHCLALTLLGSYVTDAYNGDIRLRKEVSERLAHDVRQGAHAEAQPDQIPYFWRVFVAIGGSVPGI
jgi:hypothetical protein